MKGSIKESIKKKNIKKNRQLASLMIKNPRFQKAIAELRERLGMPSSGFTDQKICQAFYDKKEKEFAKKRFDKKLMGGAKDFGKFGIYLKTEIHALLACNAFMFNMAKALEYYLYFNKLSDSDEDYLQLPYCNDYPDEYSEQMIKLAIVIDDSTTIEEVKAIWPQVMWQQRFRKLGMPVKQTKKWNHKDLFKFMESYKRKPQFKEIKNMERDELIIKFKKAGLSSKAIQGKIREMGYGVIGYEYVSNRTFANRSTYLPESLIWRGFQRLKSDYILPEENLLRAIQRILSIYYFFA